MAHIVFREERRLLPSWLSLTVLVSPPLMTVAILAILCHFHQLGALGIPTNRIILIGAVAIVVDITMALWFVSTGLVTEVRTDGLYLRFAPQQLSPRNVPLDGLKAVGIVSWNPLRDYGRAGIRREGNSTAYVLMTDRAVRLDYHDGHHVLISSREPEELVKAIESLRT